MEGGIYVFVLFGSFCLFYVCACFLVSVFVSLILFFTICLGFS